MQKKKNMIQVGGCKRHVRRQTSSWGIPYVQKKIAQFKTKKN